MAVDQEDRLDRNNRTINEVSDRVTEKLSTMDKAIAVVSTKLEGLTETVNKRLDNLDATLRDSITRYSTKEEVKDLALEIDKIKTGIGWAVKIILGAFLLALVAVVFRNGVPHG